MKKLFIIIGIILIVVMAGFALVACSEGSASTMPKTAITDTPAAESGGPESQENSGIIDQGNADAGIENEPSQSEEPPAPSEPVTYVVTATKNVDSAGEISGGGSYRGGERVTLRASTNAGYVWLGWYDGERKVSEDDSLDYTFSMPDTNKEFVARWRTNKYTVTVAADPVVGGELSGGGEYGVGDSVTLVASPNTGYYLIGWYEGDVKISLNNETTYTFSMQSANRSFVAKFEKLYYRVNEEEVEDEAGEYLLFGYYPQTEITDSAITSALTAAAGSLPTESDGSDWTSYGYYINDYVSNFMWYIDLTYSGEKYRGVYFTSYRPYYTMNSGSADNSYQDENGYSTSTVYWFKYEPIKWRILSEEDGEALILCEMIIDSQEYYPSDSSSSFSHNGGTGYANNYALSNIRAWLNDTFYNTAFTDLQKQLIVLTTVDNSARSTLDSGNNLTQATSYYCADTADYIFLLSEQEVTNSAYGFNSSYGVRDTARQKKPTDYAKSQEVWASTFSGAEGNGWWWLRSPSRNDSRSACRVNTYGLAFHVGSVYCTDSGVVPALKIRI